MFKALATSVLEELEEIGQVMFTMDKPGSGPPKAWEGPVKYRILFFIGELREHIFDCYIDEYNDAMQITDVEASDWMRKQSKGVLDAYIYLMLKSVHHYAKLMACERVVVSSYLPMFAEHLVDLSFNVRSRTTTGQVQGFMSWRREE